jgi:hypothetical protein
MKTKSLALEKGHLLRFHLFVAGIEVEAVGIWFSHSVLELVVQVGVFASIQVGGSEIGVDQSGEVALVLGSFFGRSILFANIRRIRK